MQCRPFQYQVDVKELDAKFKALQRKLHPDFFHGKGKVCIMHSRARLYRIANT